MLITVAVLLGTFLTAVDTTIVSTAMPTVVGELGGMRIYSWVFSAYLLTSTVTVPIYGRLADIHGRKPLFLVGSAIFVAGSMLAGVSRSMPELIAFRALQGLGAGAVQPITQTIIGDIFTAAQRARMQGLFSSVWGVSAVLGPGLGGFLVQYVSWRWIFFINLPFGLASALLLSLALRERLEHHRHPLDWPGIGALSLGLTALLFALLEGGSALPWASRPVLGLLTGAAVLLAAFILQERRAADPVLSLELLSRPVVAVANAAGFLSGWLMLGINSFVPLFVQGVLRGTPTAAGAAVAAMAVGWPVGSILGGRLLPRIGHRALAVAGGVVLVAGALLVAALAPSSSAALPELAVGLVGLGLGFSTLAMIIVVQHSVPWRERATATASTQFFRTVGGAVGVAALGGLLNASLAGAPLAGKVSLERLLLPGATMSAGARAALAGALMGGLHRLFWVLPPLALLTLAVSIFLPHLPPGEPPEQARPGT